MTPARPRRGTGTQVRLLEPGDAADLGRALQRNGFERIGVARNYLRIAGRWQDHLLYQRTT